MSKFRIRNPCNSFVFTNFLEGILQIFKYLLGLNDDETESENGLLPHHDKNGNKDFNQLKRVYCEQHMVDGRVFISLTDENGQPALPVTNLNNEKQVMFVIQSLTGQSENGVNTVNGCHNGIENGRVLIDSASTKIKKGPVNGLSNGNMDCFSNGHVNGVSNGHTNGNKNGHVVQCFEIVSSKNKRCNGKLDQEMWKFGLSILYVFCVHFFSTFCTIIAQERLPDKTIYGPLPDLILDNVPYIPWAYRVTEGMIYLGILTAIITLTFHKNRFIILRRGIFMSASVYLLRAVCILITNLPMPQHNYNCDRMVYDNNWQRFRRVIIVYLGMGMKVTGMKTCGDYMFSGHTVIITLLIFFLNHYSPKRWFIFHIFVWIGGLTGILFIFLSHGHYSIDVVIAFVLAFKGCVYHQSIADNISLMKRNQNLLKKWCPILYKMESNCSGIVPNEYEWPFPSLKRIKRYLKGKTITEYISEI